MFNFLKNVFAPSKTTNELIDELDRWEVPKPPPVYFRALNNRHGNTMLLQAIAWNKINAGLQILELDKKKDSLNVTDQFPTCLNTPLILAAKIDSLRLIHALVKQGADVNAQDFKGFTALHYACLYRNHKAIEILINAGASLDCLNEYGLRPLDYYMLEIKSSDLSYRYGINQKDNSLTRMPDRDKNYSSTNNPSLSAIRWYIPHLIHNWSLSKHLIVDIDHTSKSVYEWAKWHLDNRTPVYDATLYNTMMSNFVEGRLNINLATVAALTGTTANSLDRPRKTNTF